MKPLAFAITLGLSCIPALSKAQTFKESFECNFSRGINNKPTPEFLVFSVDQYGRSAFVHQTRMPNIDTQSGPARVRRDSIRTLSIAWVGRNYVYSDSGRTYASNEARVDAIDLLDQEFSVFLDRRTSKATTRSSSYSAYLSRDGYAVGNCMKIPTPSD